MPHLTSVTFTVRAETALGQTIRITGDNKSLGQFRPKFGLELVTTPDEYPVWRTPRPVTLPTGVLLSYKYLVFSGGCFESWEDIDVQARKMVPEGGEMVVEDEIDNYTGNKSSSETLHPHVRFQLPDSPVHQKSVQAVPTPLDFKEVPYKMLLVSFNLPVQLVFKDQEVPGQRWIATWDQDSISRKTEGSVANDHMVSWMGAITPETVMHDDIETVWKLTDSDKEEITQCLAEMNCVPLFLERTVYMDHFVRCCLMRYRNIFHNVLNVKLSKDDFNGNAGESGDKYPGFIKGSNVFVDAIMEWQRANENNAGQELVWIHNYPLMLVSKLLRQRYAKETTKICPKLVFFLHVPFPTSEIFRTLSVREELLEGFLGADTLGFHTFDHARHFISSCRRFLGLQIHSIQGGRLVVEFQGRAVVIVISHVGVEKELLDTALNSPACIERIQTIKSNYQGKLIITGMDSPERLQGIPLKLLAFERLLSEFPKWRNNVVFVQHGLITLRESLYKSFFPKDDGTMMGISSCVLEIRQLCERINRQYGNVCFFKTYGPFQWPTVAERCAIWASAKVFMHTPVMEGLNLLPLEFAFTSRNATVIISEFSAASRVLNGALRINCYDMDEMSKSLDFALSMPAQQASMRRERDVHYISERSSAMWTRHILRELEADRDYTKLEKDIVNIDGENSLQKVYHGRCQAIPKEQLLERYATSKHRLIFLDYAGSITGRELSNLFVKHDFLGVSKRQLPQRTIQIIKELCKDSRNKVFIVSGNTKEVLVSLFKEILDDPSSPLGIIAHSGVAIRYGNLSLGPPDSERSHGSNAYLESKQDDGGWEYIVGGIADAWPDWMDAAGIPTIMNSYTWRTAGSEWKKTSVSTSWEFRHADPEWGQIQAQKLEKDLVKAVESVNVPVNIIRKRHTVELLPKGADKGRAAEVIMQEIRRLSKRVPDFLLAIGDDSTDEPMFSQVLNFMGSVNSQDTRFDDVYTCTVARKSTSAQYFVKDVTEVLSLLAELPSV